MSTDAVKLAWQTASDLLFGENRFKNLVIWGLLLIFASFVEYKFEIMTRIKTISNISAIENIEKIISQTKDEEIARRMRKIQKSIVLAEEQNNQSASFLLDPFNNREIRKAKITRHGNILTLVWGFAIWLLLLLAIAFEPAYNLYLPRHLIGRQHNLLFAVCNQFGG